MKKKTLVVLFCVMAFVALSVSNALPAAGPPWYQCTVISVGINGPATLLTLSNAAFPGGQTYYQIDPANPRLNTYVATALTAYSVGTPLMAYIPDLTPGAVILYMAAGVF